MAHDIAADVCLQEDLLSSDNHCDLWPSAPFGQSHRAGSVVQPEIPSESIKSSLI